MKANLVMYNTVLNGCSLAKSKVHADKCLAVMERQGVAKDEMSYVELIKVQPSHLVPYLTYVHTLCGIQRD